MRFGPINFHQGHKRLNVLFSRAKRNIDFFSSIKYKDFPMTENSGVTHMKKWFYLLESENPKPELNPNISIYAVLNDCGGFNDLISYLHVYSNRGYRLTH